MKHKGGNMKPDTIESPPAGGRGLKQRMAVFQRARARVAPRRGAWIETTAGGNDSLVSKSPPAGGRGLKLENGGAA